MKHSIITLLLILSPFALAQAASKTTIPQPQTITLYPIVTLAEQLVQEKQYRNAAIEYRRMALTTDQEIDKSGFYWGAAYAYLLNKDYSLSLKMLDFSEDASWMYEQESTLIRLDCTLEEGKINEAGFYAESLSQASTNKLRHVATSRQVKIAILNHDLKSAKSLLQSTNTDINVLNAVKSYSDGKDKSPRLGGFLGMIPGLGYAYSGEYANALRSLIMNGLFIYGMVDTADDDSWGAFSVITFFEITWYTGSIYGGVDSAHRYNKNRLQACIQVIDDQSQYKPDLKKMPVISLRYSF